MKTIEIVCNGETHCSVTLTNKEWRAACAEAKAAKMTFVEWLRDRSQALSD